MINRTGTMCDIVYLVRTCLARPISQGQRWYSISLFSWPRAGLATLPGWSLLLLYVMSTHTYSHLFLYRVMGCRKRRGWPGILPAIFSLFFFSIPQRTTYNFAPRFFRPWNFHIFVVFVLFCHLPRLNIKKNRLRRGWRSRLSTHVQRECSADPSARSILCHWGYFHLSPVLAYNFSLPGKLSTLQCTVFYTLQPKLMHPAD